MIHKEEELYCPCSKSKGADLRLLVFACANVGFLMTRLILLSDLSPIHFDMVRLLN